MRRAVFNIVVGLSVMMLLATVVVWVRSYWVSDEFYLRYRRDGEERLMAWKGRLFLLHTRPEEGVRGGVAKAGHRSTDGSAIAQKQWKSNWWVFHFENKAVPDPREIQRMRKLISDAHEGLVRLRREDTAIADAFEQVRIRRAKAERQYRLLLGASGSTETELEEAQLEVVSAEGASLVAERAWQAMRKQGPSRIRATIENEVKIRLGENFLQQALPSFWQVRCPAWMLAGISTPLPLMWMVAVARVRRRKTRGMCVACGYDLRATPGRCPECGREVKVAR